MSQPTEPTIQERIERVREIVQNENKYTDHDKKIANNQKLAQHTLPLADACEALGKENAELRAMQQITPERARMAEQDANYERERADRIKAENATLRDELAAERAKGEWLPMETAPKDGTRVLLRTCCPYPTVGYFHDAYELWFSEESDRRLADPTHWQPLPAPAQEGGE